MMKILKPQQIQELLQILFQTYPHAQCALHHRNAFELLVATILSAQCTDKRVNVVTPAFLARFPDAFSLAAANVSDVEKWIGSINFFRNKAKALVAMAQHVVERYGGHVPHALEDLITLPGVARKTANVVRGVAFGLADGIVVDTHVKRLSQRLGLTCASDPGKIERDLMELLPQKTWIDFSHMLIEHGRTLCTARKPACPRCPLHNLCPSAFQPT